MNFKRLSTEDDFNKYSDRIKEFESEFDYPLGEKTFKISHGSNGESYFSFFKKLGKVNYFIIERKGKIIAAGCSILKTVIETNNDSYDYWYLCDFKITKNYRKNKILNIITLKYFLFHYFKTNKFIAINMSPKKDNGLIKKIKKLFLFFKIDSNPFYFYEWSYDNFINFVKDNTYIEENYYLYNNNGIKDILIDNKNIPIYHLVLKDYGKKNYSENILAISNKTLSSIDPKSIFMFGTAREIIVNEFKNLGITHNSESSFISHEIKYKNSNFFTGEI